MKSQNKLLDANGVVITSLFGGASYISTPKTNSNKKKRACLGSPYVTRAKLTITPEGDKVAEPGERLDLDGMIQAALPTTDIAAIVARYKAGDESVLHVNPGFVGDAVSLPKDIYDYKAMNDLYDKVSGSFEKLPADIQALFNNSAEEYLNSIISNKAEQIVADYKAKQEAAPAAQEGGAQ